MKKLLTCLLLFTLCKNVISSANPACCTSEKQTGMTLIYSASENDGSSEKKIQADMHPLDFFDWRFN